MIPVSHKIVDVKTNMTSGLDFALDIKSADFIMELLSDLYSDPVAATVRELATNALDAQIEAGVDDPIIVNTPSNMRPFFEVRDSGVGMTPEILRDVYRLYGASTKRQTNDQVGMMGLGCKAPLAIADSFTVISVRDGVKSTCMIHKNEAGRGVLELFEEETDESNGTSVIVPASSQNISEFLTKATDLFQHWDEGTVLLNAEPPDPGDWTILSDDLRVRKYNQYSSAGATQVIIMGNVPYKVNFPELSYMDIAVKVPMGSIDFEPSREAVKKTPRTLEFVNKLSSSISSDIAASLNKVLADQPTYIEAAKFLYDFPLGYGSSKLSLTWGGYPMVDYVDIVNKYTKDWNDKLSHGNAYTYLRNIDGKTLYIQDSPSSFSKYWLRRLKSWPNFQNYDTFLMGLKGSIPENIVMEGVDSVSFDEIAKIKVKSVSTKGQNSVVRDAIEAKPTTIFYKPKDQLDSECVARLARFFQAVDPDLQFVRAFQREEKNLIAGGALHYVAALKKYHLSHVAGISEVGVANRQFLQNTSVDLLALDDPAFQDFTLATEDELDLMTKWLSVSCWSGLGNTPRKLSDLKQYLTKNYSVSVGSYMCAEDRELIINALYCYANRDLTATQQV